MGEGRIEAGRGGMKEKSREAGGRERMKGNVEEQEESTGKEKRD